MKIAILLPLIIYLLFPNPIFPSPPPGSLVSSEPADTESVYRRAYYTNLSRLEVMRYYKSIFTPSVRLNHPPEDAQALIRDQTKSSWLEELVQPWRDAFYINGFYPTKPTEQININNRHYQAKIIVRHIPTATVARLTALGLSLVSIRWLLKEYAQI